MKLAYRPPRTLVTTTLEQQQQEKEHGHGRMVDARRELHQSAILDRRRENAQKANLRRKLSRRNRLVGIVNPNHPLHPHRQHVNNDDVDVKVDDREPVGTMTLPELNLLCALRTTGTIYRRDFLYPRFGLYNRAEF